MICDLTKHISHYAPFFNKGKMLLDTGPLLLLTYGLYDKKASTSFLNKIGYQPINFEALSKFLMSRHTKHSKKLRLIITPHIFTEFYKHVEKDFNGKMHDFFKIVAPTLINLKERNICKNTLLNHPHFIELEIGELSLFCSCEPVKFNDFNIIIHHDSTIDTKFINDKNILTIHVIDYIQSWYFTEISK